MEQIVIKLKTPSTMPVIQPVEQTVLSLSSVIELYNVQSCMHLIYFLPFLVVKLK
jgi:hypothetical protein